MEINKKKFKAVYDKIMGQNISKSDMELAKKMADKMDIAAKIPGVVTMRKKLKAKLKSLLINQKYIR